jgi:phenylpropionate dioxygenase-like ring-hydroxylating dioxygenase large terminal subunit
MQEIIHRDGRPVPPQLARTAYRFLGNEDIPFSRYTSREFFRREMVLVWPKVWQWVCREEHLPEAGDYVTYEIGPYSFLIVRTPDGTLRGYYNSCLHRGTKLRPTGSTGNAVELRCPFHGWTWSLEGELRRVSCPWDLPHVTPERFSLPQVQIDVWGGFVFLNMDENARPLRQFLGAMCEDFQRWDLAGRFVEVHIEKVLHANWKSAKEAFMENYHTHETHPQLLAGNGDEMTQYDVLGDHVARFYVANGVSSPHLDRPLSEKELLETMLVGDRSMLSAGLEIKEGESARTVMARYLRQVIGERYRADLSRYTDTEILDVIEYQLFPNMIVFPGISISMVYRFRPIGMDPNRTLFELLVLRPIADDGERPDPAQPVRLREEDSFTTVPGMDAALGAVYDQDTGILRSQQEGFHASYKGAETLTNYQEVCVRHLHRTLDKYLHQDKISP